MSKDYNVNDIVAQVIAELKSENEKNDMNTANTGVGLETPKAAKCSRYYKARCKEGHSVPLDEYKCLLEPITIGVVNIKNRFVMPAMGSNYACKNGFVTDQMIDYYTARAKGGFGLIVIEVTAIHPAGKAITQQPGLWKDEFIPGYRKLIDSIHAHGAKVFVQLHHAGRQTNPEVNGGFTPVAPSPIGCPIHQTLPHELTTEEVYETIDLFGDAARRAKEAGADGVELNGAHGYLIAQFMSAYSNKRIDEFGGDFRGRMKFPVEIIKAIKESCGPNFPVQFRFSGEDHVAGGRSLMEAQMVAKQMERCGVSSISVSGGTYATLEWMSAAPSKEQGYNAYSAEAVKKVVKIPVIVAGRIIDPDTAKSIIEQGKSDLVALGRTSIADPEFPKKVAAGRTCELIHCISCLQGCLEGIFTGGQISCLANPLTGREGDISLELTENPKKVLVVGAGPAGLNAAWMAAKRGHEVVLYEKNGMAGGQFRLAAVPPTKQDITTLIKSYVAHCEKYGVEIRYNTEFTMNEIYSEKAEAVVLATGGVPLIPNIPGIHNPKFKNAIDVLDGKTYFGHNVLVVGGGMVGAETADYIADQGAEVSVIEFKPAIAGDVQMFVRNALMKRLQEKNTKMFPGAKVTEFFDDGVAYEDVETGKAAELRGFDTVVLAMGSKSFNPLEEELQGKVELYTIGDAKKAGKAITGITQAAEIQKEL